MARRVSAAVKKQIGRRKCCHYWIIERSQGPTSWGVCKFCGEEREFDNFGPEAWWGRDMPQPSELTGSGLQAIDSDERDES